MRILFVTSNRLGDAVLSTGLADYLQRRYPQAQFTIVCGPVAEGVFARMPQRERTVILRKRPYGGHWLPLWAAMVGTWWDLVVDIRGSALAWLVPTWRRATLTRRHPGQPKIVELAGLFGVTPPPLPVAWTSAQDRALAATLLPADRPVVALAPTANWAPKVWPADGFAAAFRAVQARLLPGAVPVVFAGPGDVERRMASPLLTALPEAIDLTGRFGIPETAACLARAALFIGNDSGLMHLAAAAGAPTLGLFGPTNAAEYAPVGRCARAVVGPGADMADITVGQVAAAAASLLADCAMTRPVAVAG